jgi:uncharacterized protein DUF2589
MPRSETPSGGAAAEELSSLPFKPIIGGPLTAAIQAQAVAARAIVDFVRAVGLKEVNGRIEGLEVSFAYRDRDGRFRRVKVPILTVIPIPFIVVDPVEIAVGARRRGEKAAAEEPACGFLYDGASFRLVGDTGAKA